MVKLRPDQAAGRLDVVGEHGGRGVARVSITFTAPDREAFPVPRRHLTERVSALSGDAFRLSGMQNFTDLCDQIERHRGDPTGLRVLGGCGCGRNSRYFAANLGKVTQLLGCDIDPEGVEWCAQNLPGQFSQSSPEPPLPYDDGEVDVVLAASVFTHLRRDDQRQWLRELRRILSPRGLLLASVHGEYAYVLNSRQPHHRSSPGSIVYRADAFRALRRLRREGFIDSSADPALDGIAPAGYYRLVFQSPAYTKRIWSESFELLDYLECGLTGHQDLVVMRPLR
jgi:SAM-dependent methyltransferase